LSESQQFKHTVAAKVRGDDIAKPSEQSGDAVHELYFGLVIASALVGGAVYVACDRWHTAWASLSLEEIARKGHEPLAAQYPLLSAVLAALIVLVVLRIFVFMHRLESR
jgi:hypothetical protein